LNIFSSYYCVSVSHEIGHNLDLHHSNEEFGSNGGIDEYGDYTGIMGTGPMNDDTHRCFNAAKMAELGWYGKIVSFNPVTDSFDGKVIGVADYGDATDNHTLVVDIINPVSTEENIFLTLNTKKGTYPYSCVSVYKDASILIMKSFIRFIFNHLCEYL